MPPIDTAWENHTGVVIGWGTQFFGGPFAKVLMEVEVPIWKNTDCQNVYAHRIFDSVMCAGDAKGGRDSCQVRANPVSHEFSWLTLFCFFVISFKQGDSGGPMMIQLSNKRWVVAGIVSWGIHCGEPNHPGIYTRVNNYIKWVIENSVF